MVELFIQAYEIQTIRVMLTYHTRLERSNFSQFDDKCDIKTSQKMYERRIKNRCFQLLFF